MPRENLVELVDKINLGSDSVAWLYLIVISLATMVGSLTEKS